MLSLLVSTVLVLGVQGQNPNKPSVGNVTRSNATFVHKPTIYDLSMKTLDGKMVPLSKYKGKVILIVNTASKSDYASQVKDMEKLYQEKGEKGLVVLAFPSNDFKNEPKSTADLKKYFETSNETTYPVFSKVIVSGPDSVWLFRLLTHRGLDVRDVKDDFEKFLLDRSGKFVARYDSDVEPDSVQVKQDVDKALAKAK